MKYFDQEVTKVDEKIRAATVNMEAEQALLGAILANNQVYFRIGPNLKASHFSHPAHAKIFDTAARIIEGGGEANELTLAPYFVFDADLETAGGTKYLAALVAGVISYASAPDYADMLVDTAARRMLVDVSDYLKAQVVSPEAQTPEGVALLCGETVSRIQSAAAARLRTDNGSEVINRIATRMKGGGQHTKTGFQRLDNALAGGFYSGKLYGFEAGMKAGKTTLLASIAYNMATNGYKILYLALEMGADEIMQRMVARHIGCSALDLMGEKAKRNTALQEKVAAAAQDFKTMTFQTRPRMKLDELKTVLAMAGRSGKYDGIIIDYYQLVTGANPKESSATHLDNVAQTMAEAVKSWPYWIATAAQVNRDGETRGGDGLKAACDVLFQLHTAEVNGGWNTMHLEMRASRYTPYHHVGTEHDPAYQLRPDVGPYFEERKQNERD